MHAHPCMVLLVVGLTHHCGAGLWAHVHCMWMVWIIICAFLLCHWRDSCDGSTAGVTTPTDSARFAMTASTSGPAKSSRAALHPSARWYNSCNVIVICVSCNTVTLLLTCYTPFALQLQPRLAFQFAVTGLSLRGREQWTKKIVHPLAQFSTF